MKELYEAPEAKVIAFVANLAIASDWNWAEDSDSSAGTSDIDTDFGGNNPEGGYN